VVLLDADILWQPAFSTPEDGYRAFFASWLRLCLGIHQAARPVVLFGGGCAVPANIEPLAERRYFSAVHYLALTCDAAELMARLRARPAWRASAEEPFLSQQLAFNAWLRDPPAEAAALLAPLDTSSCAVDVTIGVINRWISAALSTPIAEASTPARK
jgi:hypothetical protein